MHCLSTASFLWDYQAKGFSQGSGSSRQDAYELYQYVNASVRWSINNYLHAVCGEAPAKRLPGFF